jgi:hypothetical protein
VEQKAAATAASDEPPKALNVRAARFAQTILAMAEFLSFTIELDAIELLVFLQYYQQEIY